MTLPVPPPELQACINVSCQTYNIPVDILVGVWIKESGGNYPNDFVNDIGYGGLFGTTEWNAPTQQQCNYAASILRNLYNQYGSWSLTLYHYSGGGYIQVPGQTTFDGGVMLTTDEHNRLFAIYDGMFGDEATSAYAKLYWTKVRASVVQLAGGALTPAQAQELQEAHDAVKAIEAALKTA